MERKILKYLPECLGITGVLKLDQIHLICDEKCDYTIENCEYEFYEAMKQDIGDSDKLMVISRHIDGKWDMLVSQRYWDGTDTDNLFFATTNNKEKSDEVISATVKAMIKVMGQMDKLTVLVQENDREWSNYFASNCGIPFEK